ncbi:phosphotransferase family protein [Phenylobacterium sp.]|jgi:aminoglycoside phosphotransferase (APT) family kinase protein|uniref:phosphotransferase family protein n=1 Tax=Phenylobacterium sp. TaxID=1871053 RepID=UPI0037C5AD96
MRTDQIARVIAERFPDARLRSVEKLKGGVSAEVYRADLSLADGADQSVVLRAMGKSGLESAREYALLTSLHNIGIPTPRPFCFDDSRHHVDATYVLMAFVDGASDIPLDMAGPRIALMAEALAAIHKVPKTTLPQLPDRLDPLQQLTEFLPVGEEWRPLRDYCESLENSAYKGVPVLLHGDFWPQNLIWKAGRIAAILDWEDAAFGDPLSDVACAVLELRYLFDDLQIDRFLASYRRHAEIDPQRLALWQVYVASAAQHYMGGWGLELSREAHMRQMALHQIREAAAILGIGLPGSLSNV